MWGGQLDVNPIQLSARCVSEVGKYRFPILFFRGVFKATPITLCFIPNNDLEINKLNFVVGHGTVVLAWLHYYQTMIATSTAI